MTVTRGESVTNPLGPMSLSLSLPETERPAGGFPAVVVVHELFGLKPEIVAVAERFAGRGWAAAAPDLFSTGSAPRCVFRALRETASRRPGPVTAQLEATRAWLAALPQVDGDRLAVIGFCMGGAFALLLGGTAAAGLRAVSANYAQAPRTEALRGCPPVVAAYGGRDRVIGTEAGRLERALTELGVEHEVTTYPSAGHSFLTDGQRSPLLAPVMFPLHPGFVAEAAEPAWERIWAWLDTHVVRG